jgi:hypothetical protein
MKSVDELTKAQLVDLFNRCWMTHDGMWFYSCLQAYGIEQANALNKSAIKFLAPIEIGRMKRTFGITKEKIESFDELADFFHVASALFIPDFMGATFSFPKKNILRWKFKPKGCFAYKGMMRIGVADRYECGVIYRVACWMDALKISYQAPEIGRCRMVENETCAGEITFDLQ